MRQLKNSLNQWKSIGPASVSRILESIDPKNMRHFLTVLEQKKSILTYPFSVMYTSVTSPHRANSPSKISLGHRAFTPYTKSFAILYVFFRENTDFTNLLQEKTTRLLTPVFHKRVSFWSKSEQQQQSSARGDILAMLAGKIAKI